MQEKRRLYLDNAATSHPKPQCVWAAMSEYASRLGASPGRGAYAEAREAGSLVSRCRRSMARLVNAESPGHIIFTLNTTDALNLAIKGIVHRHVARGERVHLITSWMDHNSVLRPFNALADQFGVEQTRIECDPSTGHIDPDDIRRSIGPDTRLVALIHGSNVTGTVQPIASVGAICRERGVPLLVDGAQTVGHLPVDMERMNIDLLACPGHKGLLGPLGTGVLAIRNGAEHRLATWREGGTGSVSELDTQPLELPDRFESGSHNAIGIVGLDAALRWIEERGIESLWCHEQVLMRRWLDGLRGDGDHGLLPGLRLLGPQGPDDRVGVFSLVLEGMRPADLADELELRAGIQCRAGLHCAPLAHRTMGTAPEQVGPDMCGATRLSVGPFVTAEDIDDACGAIAEICGEIAGAPV